jgi:hypothetical protein
VAKASTAEVIEIDPRRPGDRLWQNLVLMRPWSTYWAKAPSDEVLKRMFDPVPDSNKPTEGGLGIQPAVFMRATDVKNRPDLCR